MSLIVGDNSKSFEPIPEGLHQAACCDVRSLGLVDTPWGKKEKVEIRWQLDLVNEKTGKRFVAPKRYGASLSKKASLRKDLETWRGRPFTEKELEAFDLEVLLGVNCQIQVQHKPGDDGTVYSNVVAVVPLGKGMTKVRIEDYVRMAEREGKGKPAEAEAEGEDTPF